jgi:phospholipase/carboxylesterase
MIPPCARIRRGSDEVALRWRPDGAPPRDSMRDVSDLLESIEIETAPSPTAAVIWLHGLGADGHDFEPLVPELSPPGAVRFVLPHAPMRPVTVNAGHVMRAWYDVVIRDGMRVEDREGVRVSQRQIEALIARETARGIPANRIVLAGFSQGGAMALHTGLRQSPPVAGIVALSCSLPSSDVLATEAPPASRAVPIFMAHGTGDDLIPIERGTRARDLLLGLGYRVTWHQYRMPHSVCDEEVGDVAAWMAERLSSERG